MHNIFIIFNFVKDFQQSEQAMSWILIADAGSSKTDWAMLDTPQGKWRGFSSAGINPVTFETPEISNILDSVSGEISDLPAPDKIYFYGAGCSTPDLCAKMEDLLHEKFGSDTIDVQTDLTGAARSLLQKNEGIACILGTGSNSGLYDGNRIVDNIPPLGFILGDEGSGTALGKRIISDYFKRLLPEETAAEFEKEFGLTMAETIEKTYRQKSPNRFLSSVVPFLKKHLHNEAIGQLVREEFSKFIKRNLLSYPRVKELPVCFTGSIACHFSDPLLDEMQKEGLKTGKITDRPLVDLIKYHIKYE